MKTLYQTITTYEGENFEDFLDRFALIEIFKPIIDRFDPPTAKGIIKYIAHAYSRESAYILTKEDWRKQKENCARAAKLNKDLWQQVVYLMPDRDEVEEGMEDPVPAMIATVATKYLNRQNDQRNRDLKSLYDLKEEMIMEAAKPGKDHNDFEHKYKCRERANNIQKWIAEAEEKATEEDIQLKSGKTELKNQLKKGSSSIRPENTV